MVGALFGVFLEVNIADALAEDGDPVLGELVAHDAVSYTHLTLPTSDLV